MYTKAVVWDIERRLKWNNDINSSRLSDAYKRHAANYRQVFNIGRTLVGN